MMRHYAWVIHRVAAAALGGYALAAVFAICLACILPGSRADAVASGLLISFAVYVAAILWAFGSRSPARVWGGLATLTALCGALAVVFSMISGP